MKNRHQKSTIFSSLVFHRLRLLECFLCFAACPKLIRMLCVVMSAMTWRRRTPFAVSTAGRCHGVCITCCLCVCVCAHLTCSEHRCSSGRFSADRIFRGFLFLGRRIFSRILSPDFFPHFCGGKSAQKKILQQNPRQNPPKCIQQKSPTHVCRGGGTSVPLTPLRVSACASLWRLASHTSLFPLALLCRDFSSLSFVVLLALSLSDSKHGWGTAAPHNTTSLGGCGHLPTSPMQLFSCVGGCAERVVCQIFYGLNMRKIGMTGFVREGFPKDPPAQKTLRDSESLRRSVFPMPPIFTMLRTLL